MSHTNKITPRDPHFSFNTDLPVNWHSGNPAISHFYNGLSLTFPEGERFFVDSVRHFRDQITDPKLLEDVRGFSGQETIHSREHVAYNKFLAAKGLKPEPLEAGVRFGMNLSRKLPKKMQLAFTCAIEHYTALFAEVILSDPHVMADAHPDFANVWRWHAMEEAEHKAVAFDVSKFVDPGFGGYLRRCLAMTITTTNFNLVALFHLLYLMKQSGDFFNGRAWWQAMIYLWGKPGVWRRVLAGVPAYYRPSFHPNDQDTVQLVAQWRKWYATELRPVDPAS
ncbi:MAG: metal-dependent hydrolase [Parvibaculum sp.]